MIRRLLFVAAAGALLLAFTAVTPTQAAPPHGATCTLHGNANFTNTGGVTYKPSKKVTYTFSGNLSNCQKGTLKVAPPSQTNVTGTVSASGYAVNPGISCEGGLSKGTATVKWSTGTSTTVAYKTYGVGALTLVQGKVTASGDPDVRVGDQAAGALVFQTTTPQNCVQGGLKSASFDGQVGTGWLK